MIESYFKLALDQMKHPCFIKDLEFKYLYINSEAAMLAGLKPEDLIQKNDFEIFGVEKGREYREKDLAILNGGTVDPFDTFTNTAGVTKKYFIIRNVINNKNNEPCAIFGIRIDMDA